MAGTLPCRARIPRWATLAARKSWREACRNGSALQSYVRPPRYAVAVVIGPPILGRMADPRRPPSRVYEEELTATVKAGGERWLTELRLAIFGIIISVGIGAADIGLQVGGWVGGLVGGVGSVVVLVGVLWGIRPTSR